MMMKRRRMRRSKLSSYCTCLSLILIVVCLVSNLLLSEFLFYFRTLAERAAKRAKVPVVVIEDDPAVTVEDASETTLSDPATSPRSSPQRSPQRKFIILLPAVRRAWVFFPC